MQVMILAAAGVWLAVRAFIVDADNVTNQSQSRESIAIPRTNPWEALDVDGGGPYVLDGEEKAHIAADETICARKGHAYAKQYRTSLLPDPATGDPDAPTGALPHPINDLSAVLAANNHPWTTISDSRDLIVDGVTRLGDFH